MATLMLFGLTRSAPINALSDAEVVKTEGPDAGREMHEQVNASHGKGCGR